MPDPFSYPARAHIRQHGPRGYARHEGFRPWLRDEFKFRCVFCLRLNHPRLVHFRRLWLEIVAMASRYHPVLYRELMGYQDDLPNLGRLRPPQGNARSEGIANSCYELRNRGELPDTY